MQSIIEQIYHGDLNEEERYSPTLERLRQKQTQAWARCEMFAATLSEEQRNDFWKVIYMHTNQIPLELKQSYMNGFRIGARMVIEIFHAPIGTEDT